MDQLRSSSDPYNSHTQGSELLCQYIERSTPPNYMARERRIYDGDEAATTTMATAMAMAMAMATAAVTAQLYSCKPVGGLTRPVSGLLTCVYLLPAAFRQPSVSAVIRQ